MTQKDIEKLTKLGAEFASELTKVASGLTDKLKSTPEGIKEFEKIKEYDIEGHVKTMNSEVAALNKKLSNLNGA